jgi:hypothetical protein
MTVPDAACVTQTPCAPPGGFATHSLPVVQPPPGPLVAPHVRDSLLKLTGDTVAAPPLAVHDPPAAAGVLAAHVARPSLVTPPPPSIAHDAESDAAGVLAVHVPPSSSHCRLDGPQVVPLASHAQLLHVAGEKMSPSYVSACVGYELGHGLVRVSS